MSPVLHLWSSRCRFSVCGLQVGAIKSPKFTRAFFGMFLGDNPVSRDGKRNIQSGLARFVTEE